MVQQKINPNTLELQERLVKINRVSKTVKGGRIQRFTAIMVVGDGNGHVGFGLGKAAEVPEAIRKSLEDAKKNIIKVSMNGTTIPHQVIGEYGAGRVLLKPASEGTGVIAGGYVRAVIDMVGIKDIRAKCLTSRQNTGYTKPLTNLFATVSTRTRKSLNACQTMNKRYSTIKSAVLLLLMNYWQNILKNDRSRNSLQGTSRLGHKI